MVRRPEHDRKPAASKVRTTAQRGQMLVMFAAAMVLLVGLLAIVIDVTWYWTNSLKVQRAADAAALAGAVWLPDQPGKATTAALAAAKADGYVPGSGVTVTAVPDPARNIQLDTQISAPVPTFFMNLFGIRSLQATRRASAEYVLPVPMGSPLNYFGAFGTLRGGMIQTDTGWSYATRTQTHYTSPAVPTANGWTTPSKAFIDESPDPAENATAADTVAVQGFTRFRPENQDGLANFGLNQTITPNPYAFGEGGGIEIVVQASSSVAGCQLQVEVTKNADAGPAATVWWGATTANGNRPILTTTPREYEFGGDAATAATDVGDWWRPSTAGGWVRTDFADAKFGVRIKALGAGACLTATTSVDYIKVRLNYQESEPPIKGPNNESLAKQGVWAGILSQGADIQNGDFYSPANSPDYLKTAYDYAVELQPGTTGGSLYIFDPVFCDTDSGFGKGMGDTWYNNDTHAVSTWYDLWDTMNTPYDTTDDVYITGSGDLFKNSRGSDESLSGANVGSGITNCQRGTTTDKTSGAYWHNRWWRMATGLAGPSDTIPKVYRVRVTSTDPNSASAQASTNALNNFSLFASVRGRSCPGSAGCPRVYGLGVMEAFAPLEGGATADLYLSQIGAAYAGKTIRVSLWDAGDTNMTADLSFRMPNGTTYAAAPFTYTATKVGSGNACHTTSGSGSSIRTNSGGTNWYGGCWLVFNIPIPDDYTASTPTGEPGPGWWKIRYTMTGSGSASDLTTWKTQIVGNPVHLVIP
jgi:hypothetical protein